MNENWIVTEISTGKILCHCGDIHDAMMMVNFDPHNRKYARQRLLEDMVIDITSSVDKQLPGQLGLPPQKIKLEATYREALPDSEYEIFDPSK